MAQFLVEAASRKNRPLIVRPMTPVAAFVVTRALMGAIRAAVMENSPHLETQEFEDELVRLCLLFGRK